MNAAQAIARSISHNEIVTLEFTANESTRAEYEQEALQGECEDWAENGRVFEYWGTSESGGEWRVHVIPNC